MRELKRTLACPSIYARASALDMVESVSADATVRKEQWQLTGTVEVFLSNPHPSTWIRTKVKYLRP